MPTIPSNVQSGDLITASFMNSVLTELSSLESRVTKLEQGGAVAGAISITSVSPQPVQAGQEVTIVGTNFGFLEGSYSYTFNGVATPTISSGSTDTVLTCQVPLLPGLSPGGSQVTLSMNNGTTTAVTPITVLPATVVVQGTVDVIFDSVSPDPITAGTSDDFTFHLQSRASATVTLTLTPAITMAGGGTPFPVTLLSAASEPIPNNSVTLNPGDLVSFLVRVAIPAATNGTGFTLSVTGAGSGLASSSGPQPFTVGQYANPDTSFVMAPSSSAPPTALTGTTITGSISANQFIDIYIDAKFTETGNYDLTLTTPGTTNWLSTIVSPATPFTVSAADIGSTGTADETIHLRVQPNAGATDPGQLQLNVQHEGATTSRTLTFDLHATA